MGIGLHLHHYSYSYSAARRALTSAACVDPRAVRQVQRQWRRRRSQQDDQRRARRVARPSLRIPDHP